MLYDVYRHWLRVPQFRGKHRVDNWLRQRLSPPRSIVSGGFAMELDPREWAQIALLAEGTHEPMTVTLYGRLLGRGGVYVDVGAHVGFLTLTARMLVGTSGTVIAIEPQPYNCEKVLTNWAINDFDNIVVYVAAAGDTDRSVTLKAQAQTDKSRLTLDGHGVNDSKQSFIVPLVRLDKVLADQNVDHVDLINIDVEGFELEVLRGLGERMTQVRNIILEVLPVTPLPIVSEIANLLTTSGFRPKDG